MFRRWRKTRTRGVFLSFFLSYVIVLVIPIVIIGSLIYGRILRQLETEVRLANQSTLRQAAQVMDLRLQELGLLAGQISLNPRIRDFLFQRGSGPEDILKTMDLCKEMGIFQAPNRFLVDLIVYSYKADAVVSRQSRYTPAFYYEHVARPEGLAFQDWQAQMHREHLGTITAGDYLGPDGSRQRYLTYLQSVPTNWGQAAGTMMAFIDGTQIRQLFAPLVAERQGVALIADRTGRVLISTGRVPAGIWAFPAQAGLLQRTLGGRRMVIYYERSSINGWNYISMIPANIFNAKVSAIRWLIFTVLALCLLVGFAMATVLSWRNYRPIRAVLDVLRPLRPRGFDMHNEWAVIMESAQEMAQENDRLQSFLTQNEAQVLSNQLRRLLHGRVPPGERAEILRMRCETGTRYAVLAVDIEIPPGQAADSARNLMSLAAVEGIERLTQGLVTEIEDERLGVLAALGEGQDDEAAVLRIARAIQAGLDRDYQIPVSIGLSIAENSEMIPEAFRQALQAADYRIVSGRCAITPFSEVAQTDKSYYYPLDWERQIINHIKTGDLAAVSALVDEVYTENFVRRHLPLPLVRCVFYDLMGTALKVLNELNIGQEALGNELAFDRYLMQTDTSAEMRENLKQIFGRICAWIAGKHESHNAQLKENMLAILAKEYADPNLGLAQLAGRVSVSASYLCRFFKDQTGNNFADYLNRLRLEHAKRMLREGSSTIGEIAVSVGYLSANTFIRIFKKYEGITPGQFRGRFEQTAV